MLIFKQPQHADDASGNKGDPTMTTTRSMQAAVLETFGAPFRVASITVP
jgi:hypothetical protein